MKLVYDFALMGSWGFKIHRNRCVVVLMNDTIPNRFRVRVWSGILGRFFGLGSLIGLRYLSSVLSLRVGVQWEKAIWCSREGLE